MCNSVHETHADHTLGPTLYFICHAYRGAAYSTHHNATTWGPCHSVQTGHEPSSTKMEHGSSSRTYRPAALHYSTHTDLQACTKGATQETWPHMAQFSAPHITPRLLPLTPHTYTQNHTPPLTSPHLSLHTSETQHDKEHQQPLPNIHQIEAQTSNGVSLTPSPLYPASAGRSVSHSPPPHSICPAYHTPRANAPTGQKQQPCGLHRCCNQRKMGGPGPEKKGTPTHSLLRSVHHPQCTAALNIENSEQH